MLEINLKIKVTKIFNDCFLLLDQFRFCEIHFIKYQLLADHCVVDTLLSVPFLCGQEEYEKFHTSSSIPAGMLFFLKK